MIQKQVFQKKIEGKVKVDRNGCWVWQGTIDRDGYGRLHVSGTRYIVHRLALHAWTGFELDPSVSVHHTCANRRCCNPDHLQPISIRENVAEMFERQYYKSQIKKLENEVKLLRRKLKCQSKNSKELSMSRGS